MATLEGSSFIKTWLTWGSSSSVRCGISWRCFFHPQRKMNLLFLLWGLKTWVRDGWFSHPQELSERRNLWKMFGSSLPPSSRVDGVRDPVRRPGHPVVDTRLPALGARVAGGDNANQGPTGNKEDSFLIFFLKQTVKKKKRFVLGNKQQILCGRESSRVPEMLPPSPVNYIDACCWKRLAVCTVCPRKKPDMHLALPGQHEYFFMK